MTQVRKFSFDASFEEEDLKLHEPRYSHHELEMALQQRHHQAYEKGVQEALSSVHARNESQLQIIHTEMQTIVEMHQGIMNRLHHEIGEICHHMATVLFSEISRTVATQEIENFLDTLHDELQKHPAIQITVHPDTRGELEKKFADIKKSLEEKVVLTILEDGSLELADCQVTWESGGVERIVDKAVAAIQEATQRYQEHPVWAAEDIKTSEDQSLSLGSPKDDSQRGAPPISDTGLKADSQAGAEHSPLE